MEPTQQELSQLIENIVSIFRHTLLSCDDLEFSSCIKFARDNTIYNIPRIEHDYVGPSEQLITDICLNASNRIQTTLTENEEIAESFEHALNDEFMTHFPELKKATH